MAVKLVSDPEVVLLSRPVMEINGLNKFLKDHNLSWEEWQKKIDSNIDLGDKDAEYLIEACARTCYLSFGKGRSHEEHLKNIIEVGHGSVMEHPNFTFMIWNVSRNLLAELTRHRAGVAFSVLSQRFVDCSDTSYVIPPGIQQMKEDKPDLYEEWVQHMERSQELYVKLTEGLADTYKDIENKTEKRKKSRQAARSVLPGATETKIAMTLNGRSVRHICEMRGHPAADLEIRKLAVKIFKIVQKEYPMICYGMEVVKLEDETEGIESKFRKI